MSKKEKNKCECVVTEDGQCCATVETTVETCNIINDLEEKILRQNADMVNFRKRKEEEVSKMLRYCNEDLIKELLPVIDNFERAISMEDKADEQTEKFLEGFKMVYSNLQNILSNFEVKAIDGVNVPFDPVYHNAVMVDKVTGVASGNVLEILQKGYILKDRVIRPAMVKVSE